MLENVSFEMFINDQCSVGLFQLRRIRAVTNTHRELPPVGMGHSVDEFFDDLAKGSDSGKKLPNW
jgi:alpha-mannosidase